MSASPVSENMSASPVSENVSAGPVSENVSASPVRVREDVPASHVPERMCYLALCHGCSYFVVITSGNSVTSQAWMTNLTSGTSQKTDTRERRLLEKMI